MYYLLMLVFHACINYILSVIILTYNVLNSHEIILVSNVNCYGAKCLVKMKCCRTYQSLFL